MPTRRGRYAVLGVVAATALVTSTAPVGASAAGAPRSSSGARSMAAAPPFSNPTAITNRFLPLVPGTTYVLDGRAKDDRGRLQPHRVITIVTDLTKVISGVRTLVVYERDYSAGKLVEAELAFQAQDSAGTVWNYGEYPEEYANGKLQGAPNVWIPGQARARAGIAMLARPRVGTPSYSQGSAPAIDFADRARVFQTGVRACVSARCYPGALVTDEWDALDPAAGHQRKFYAPGVGNVRVAPVGGDLEVLSLTRLQRLCAAGVASARAQAFAMDKRGHRLSKVYRTTAPVQQTLRARTTC